MIQLTKESIILMSETKESKMITRIEKNVRVRKHNLAQHVESKSENFQGITINPINYENITKEPNNPTKNEETDKVHVLLRRSNEGKDDM